MLTFWLKYDTMLSLLEAVSEETEIGPGFTWPSPESKIRKNIHSRFRNRPVTNACINLRFSWKRWLKIILASMPFKFESCMSFLCKMYKKFFSCCKTVLKRQTEIFLVESGDVHHKNYALPLLARAIRRQFIKTAYLGCILADRNQLTFMSRCK